MVPTVALPFFAPSTYQVTAVLLRSVSLAANCMVPEGDVHGSAGVTSTPAPGVPEMPVPVRGMTIGLPGAFSAIWRFAVSLPIAIGSKTTWIVQVAPGPTVPPPLPLPQLVVNG